MNTGGLRSLVFRHDFVCSIGVPKDQGNLVIPCKSASDRVLMKQSLQETLNDNEVKKTNCTTSTPPPASCITSNKVRPVLPYCMIMNAGGLRD